MNSKTIIVVGFRVDKKTNYVTGQAVMIDLFIDLMRENGYKVIPVPLNYKLGANTTVGSTSVLRILDYVRIFSIITWTLITHPNSILYFSPVANKTGFLRDALMTRIACLTGSKVYMQQFGCRFAEFYESVSDRLKSLIRNTYAKATLITTEGEAALKQLEFLGLNDRIEILNNGLPERNIKTEFVPKTYNADQPFCLFYLNNMIESKGYLHVLEAVNDLVNKRGKNVIAIFAGKFMSVIDDEKFHSPGEAKTYFDNKVKEYYLDNRVSYFPSLFGDDKAAAWSKSNMFLLPSYYVFEGQPTAVLEALAYGSVPIVTKHGLIPEMVNEDCGVFVEKKDSKGIADAVEKLMDNPEEYTCLSRGAIDRYLTNYTVDVYSDKLKTLFNKYFA